MLIRTRSWASSLRMLTLSNPNPNLNPKSLPSQSPSFSILTNPKMFFPPKNSPQKLTFYNPFSSSTTISPSKSPASDGKNGVVSESTLVVVSFYKFADFPDHADIRAPLKQLCQQLVYMLFSSYIMYYPRFSCFEFI